MATIGHRVLGSGPTSVIVLHGWFGDHSVYEPMLPALDLQRFTFAFMDYRGYGLSKEIAGSHTIAEIGGDVLALADHLGWSRFHVIGHSMGGMVVQWLAANATARIASGIAITPVPASGSPMEGETWELFSGAADDPAKRGIIIGLTTGNRHTPTWINFMVERSYATTTRDAFADYVVAWTQTNFADQVTGVPTPLLVLPGEHDLAITPDGMRATIMQWFPNAELQVLANAGHYPMVEIPVNLATIWQEFLARHA